MDIWLNGKREAKMIRLIVIMIFVFIPGAVGAEGTWTTMHSGASGVSFHAVWAAASDDVFAIGTVVGHNALSVIYHCDDNTCSQMIIIPDTLLRNIKGCDGCGDNVFAVGDSYQEGVIYHYDGNTWSKIPLNSGIPQLNDVWVTPDGSETYAVGNSGLILHYDGIEWTVMDSNLTAGGDFYGIDGANGAPIYAVGGPGTSLVRRWDGNEWQVVDTGADFGHGEASVTPQAVIISGTRVLFSCHFCDSWSTADEWVTHLWATGNGYSFYGTRYSQLYKYTYPEGLVALETPSFSNLDGIWGITRPDGYIELFIAEGNRIQHYSSEPPPEYGTITGTVTTAFAGHTDLSVINADVYLEGTDYSTKTDGDGRFTLDPVLVGDYVLRITVPPYLIPVQMNVTLTAWQNLDVGFLPLNHVILGDVNEDGRIGLEEAINALQIVSGVK